jgi:hypothetical protein
MSQSQLLLPDAPDCNTSAIFTQHTLSPRALNQMSFFFRHLEQKWSIKKRNNVYVLKQRDGSRCTYTTAYLANVLANESSSASNVSNVSSLDTDSNNIKRIQLLTFLHNALEGGWNIKKQSTMSNNYVFEKKHNGQYKMYEDDEYLTQFMKNNFRLEA